jgi:hypothetical protein
VSQIKDARNQQIADFTGLSYFLEEDVEGQHVVAACPYFRKDLAEQQGLPVITLDSAIDYSQAPYHQSAAAWTLWAYMKKVTQIPIRLGDSCDYNGKLFTSFDRVILPDLIKAGVTIIYSSEKIGPDWTSRNAAVKRYPFLKVFSSSGNVETTGPEINSFCTGEQTFGVSACDLNGEPVATNAPSPFVDYSAPEGTSVKFNPAGSSIVFMMTSGANPVLTCQGVAVESLFKIKTGNPITYEALDRFFFDHRRCKDRTRKSDVDGWGPVLLPRPKDIDFRKYTNEPIIVPVTPPAGGYGLPKAQREYSLTLHDKAIVIDGARYEIDAAITYDPVAQRIDIPARANAEIHGESVVWDDKTKTATFKIKQ